MTWNPSNPLSGDKIRSWPDAVTTQNWPQIETMIKAGHVFNNTPVINDDSGYHNLTRWKKQAGTLGDGTPAAPPVAETAQVYTKTITYTGPVAGSRQMPCWMPGGFTSATEECSLAVPIRAAVSFNILAAISSQAFNVASVALSGTTGFLITFTNPMPNTNYIVSATINQSNTGVASAFQSIIVTAKTASSVTLQCGNFGGVGSARQGLDVIVLGGWF